MSIAIKTDEKKDWSVSGGVEGDGHDHCPGCGSDVEERNRFGGEGGMPHMWSQYVHDRKDDGAACGAVWTRTTKYGQERNTKNNQQTKWLSTSAASGRVISVPSPAYEAAYERIFGHS